MSEITGWKLKVPLKKTLRSREEIRAYVIRQMNEEKDAKERYASTRSAEAFGLIPKDFDLENFLVDLLTEQIAGLYDPKAHEFYIADWIPPEDQEMVMSHELTHALEDQRYGIEAWMHAVRSDDDAELSRESVLEGSAMAAMVEYLLRGKGLKLKDLPEFDPSLFAGDLAQTPMIKKAPPFIKDSLMFPYTTGLSFSVRVLRTDGWNGFDGIFARPPANTQQILHPEVYRAGKTPAPLKVDLPDGAPGRNWTLLEENSMGEFGWKEVLKQFLDEKTAQELSVAWDGDRYVTYEDADKKRVLLFARLRLSNEAAAADFYARYSSLLAKKHPDGTHPLRGAGFFSLDTPAGSSFLRCSGRECLTGEGADRATFERWSQKLGWGPLPEVVSAEPAVIKTPR
ncbi:MAG TPA: hypothetical protein VF758_05370 [Candidatus Acidoferrum sp.]